jgi:GAF domain-containing protein
MTSQLLDSIFNTTRYLSDRDKNRANMIYALSVFLLVAFTLYALIFPLWQQGDTFVPLWTGIFYGGLSTPGFLLFLSFYILMIGGIVAVREGQLESGAWAIVAAWYLAGVVLHIYAHRSIEANGMAFMRFMLLAVLVHHRRGLIISSILLLATIAIGYLTIGSETPRDVALICVNIVISSILIAFFLQYFLRAQSTGISEAMHEQITLNRLLDRIGALLGQRLPMTQFLAQAAREIAKSFLFIQNVRIFIVDEKSNEAYLSADSDYRELPEHRRSRLGVGGLTTVGQVTSRGERSIFRSENANTAEAIFPLMVGEGANRRIVGAMELRVDVRVSNPLNQPDTVNALQSFADKLALMIGTVLQVEEMEAKLKAREAEVEQVRAQLREIERVNQRMTSSVWSQYARDIEQGAGLSFDFRENTVLPDNQWTPTLSEARRINHLVQEQNGDAQVIAVPLRVRGQVVGAMEFEIDAQRNFTPEDMELLQEVGERFGLAAENTRLLEESRRAAQREALVNQITTRLQTTTGVNATMLEAARSLREAMKANRVAIRLGKPGDVS